MLLKFDMTGLPANITIDSAVIVLWITEDHWYDDHSTNSIHRITQSWSPATVGSLPDVPSFDQARTATFVLDPDAAGYSMPMAQRMKVTTVARSHYTTPSGNNGYLITNWSDRGHDGFTSATSEASDVRERPMMLVYSQTSTAVGTAPVAREAVRNGGDVARVLLDGRRVAPEQAVGSAGVTLERKAGSWQFSVRR